MADAVPTTIVFRRNVLKTFALLPLAFGYRKAVAADDFELIELGRQLEASMLEMDALYIDGDEPSDEAFVIAYNKSESLVHRIEKLPATTMRGLKAKRLAVGWCHGGEAVDLDYGLAKTTDLRLANGILADIDAITI